MSTWYDDGTIKKWTTDKKCKISFNPTTLGSSKKCLVSGIYKAQKTSKVKQIFQKKKHSSYEHTTKVYRPPIHPLDPHSLNKIITRV